jgi:hypothetical protein
MITTAHPTNTITPLCADARCFGVGWYALTAEQLNELPEQDRINSVQPFGGSTPVLFSTAGQAQWLLDQIVTVNGEAKIKELTPLGSSGLFICYLEVTNTKRRFVKYIVPNSAHILPERPL